MDHHATAAPTYRKVLGTLLALTVITVLAAGMNVGAMNAVIALTIASIKATLVALFFMHLRHDKPMNAVIFVAGVGILAIFLMLTYLDEGQRTPQPVRQTPVAGKLAVGRTLVCGGLQPAGRARPGNVFACLQAVTEPRPQGSGLSTERWPTGPFSAAS